MDEIPCQLLIEFHPPAFIYAGIIYRPWIFLMNEKK